MTVGKDDEDTEAKHYELMRHIHRLDGELQYHLAVFGEEIRRREEYSDSKLTGLDAIYFYLIHKFHWKPSEVRGMSLEDIRFILLEEMVGWTLPPKARKST